MSPAKADMKEIETKIEKGEDLTEDETKLFMGGPMETGAEEDWEDVDTKSDEATEETKEEEKDTEKPETDSDEKEEKPKEDKEEVVAKDATVEEVKSEEDLDLNSLETELAKPLGTEDLKGFNKKEQAYFWQMRRDRQARQKAEMERDELRFAEAKRKAIEDAKEKTVETDTTHDPDDFVTYGDLNKLKEPRKDAKTEPNADVAWRQRYLNMCEGVAKDKFEDYTEVIECTDSIIATSPVYQKQVIESMSRGENPAIFMYHLIKSDTEFDKAINIARARLEAKGVKTKPKEEEKTDAAKVEKAKEVEEKIEKNANKPKTSGHHSGSEAETDKFPSLDSISEMSDDEFAAMPKKKRDAILKKYGV